MDDGGTELVFLDGKFVVPDHLAALMGGMETERYRYRDAVDRVNSGMLTDRLQQAQSETIARHFEHVRKGRDDGSA